MDGKSPVFEASAATCGVGFDVNFSHGDLLQRLRHRSSLLPVVLRAGAQTSAAWLIFFADCR